MSEHRSFSRLYAYLSCQKAYQLRYIRKVLETPAVYLESGKAFHEVTEAYDRELLKKQGGNE